jgi:hypothetical protein
MAARVAQVVGTQGRKHESLRSSPSKQKNKTEKEASHFLF